MTRLRVPLTDEQINGLVMLLIGAEHRLKLGVRDHDLAARIRAASDGLRSELEKAQKAPAPPSVSPVAQPETIHPPAPPMESRRSRRGQKRHDGEEWLTTRDAETLLGVSRATMYRLVDSGRLTQYAVEWSKHPRYKRSEIENLRTIRPKPVAAPQGTEGPADNVQ